LDNVLQLFNDHSRKVATATSILLIVLMSLTVAHTVLFFIETMTRPVIILDSTTASSSAITQPTFKVSSLELFGRLEVADTLPQALDAPETKLNLELQGIFIAQDAKLSTAIVAQKNKTGELFAIGDKLPGNATLAAVFEDHVLIRRGTRVEKLLFSDSKFQFASDRSPASTSPRSGGGISDTTRSHQGSAKNSISDKNESNNNSINNSPINTYQEKLRSDLQGTLSKAGITPVSTGESNGYKVGADAQGAIKQAGLQPGDVILSINGKPVGVASNDSALMAQVMASSRVRVEVRRGARRFFLTVPVPK
jgi:general secretion pathway protein C|tara:strand:- start:125 stop:1051 length:927 start_codon:yes stop_codon:yes gene_type:complete